MLEVSSRCREFYRTSCKSFEHHEIQTNREIRHLDDETTGSFLLLRPPVFPIEEESRGDLATSCIYGVQ